MVSDWFHTTVLDKYTSLLAGNFLNGLKAENIVINERGVILSIIVEESVLYQIKTVHIRSSKVLLNIMSQTKLLNNKRDINKLISSTQ